MSRRPIAGDRPIGLVIAVAVFAFFALLPALIVPAFYFFANVHAIVTGPDFASDTMNIPAFLTGLVVTVALLVCAMAFALGRIGRSLSPKRRRDDRP